MKILLLGDPHGSKKIKEIPLKGVELILTPGDLGNADLMRKFSFQFHGTNKKWTEEVGAKLVQKALNESVISSKAVLKHLTKSAPVYFVYGNVEPTDKKDSQKIAKKRGIKLLDFNKEVLGIKNTKILNGKIVTYKGISIAGYPFFVDERWVREFAKGRKEVLILAKKQEAKAKKFFVKLKYIDILLVHQPPLGVLDKVNNPIVPKGWNGKHAGSKLILDYIKKYQPKYVICGHIHEAKGKKKIGKTTVVNVGHSGDYSFLEI